MSEDCRRRLFARPIPHISSDSILYPALPADFSKNYWFARQWDGLQPPFVRKLLPVRWVRCSRLITALLVQESSSSVPRDWSHLHPTQPPMMGILAFVCALKIQKRRVLRPTSTNDGSHGACSAVVSNYGCARRFSMYSLRCSCALAGLRLVFL